MKKILFLFTFSLIIFSGCKDCETIELDDSRFECPDLMANIGDSCDDGNPNTVDDAVNGNCECIGGQTEFDCPDLLLNIGDDCTDNNDTTINDTVTDNCECIGESIFDCPDLSLNIGDPCDDGNPDTNNDVVDENCNCVGEQFNDCEGILFASRIDVEFGGDINGWFFDSAIKSPGSALSFSNIEEKSNGFLSADEFNTNFAAFDPSNQVYTFAYQYNQGTPNPLYLAETSVFNSTFLPQEPTFAAPVFLGDDLYAINVVNDPPMAQYTILQIDQATGISTPLLTNNLMVNSPMVNEAMSSTSNQTDLIYFASATNLLVFNPTSLSVTEVDIDNSYTNDNQIVYYGLEYKQDSDEVIAIKGRVNSMDKVSELVSISTEGNYSVNTIFDIKNNLGIDNDEEIYFEVYSTTFSQCDNTYYISELVELDADVIETFLIEINLNENTLIEQKFDDFIYGLEMSEN